MALSVCVSVWSHHCFDAASAIGDLDGYLRPCAQVPSSPVLGRRGVGECCSAVDTDVVPLQCLTFLSLRRDAITVARGGPPEAPRTSARLAVGR